MVVGRHPGAGGGVRAISRGRLANDDAAGIRRGLGASRQGLAIGTDYDLRVRRAFFGEGRNIGRPEVLLDIAREAALDMPRFERDVASPEARAAVLEESRIGREQFHVRGTPTLTLADGTHLHLPIAFPRIQAHRIVGMAPPECVGEACSDAVRALFERALGGQET
ncbi:MAG: DsbA family protein [Gemmatimonadaceae bacterium]|nr:DsbA family protein [Gemmatimonadaceae bacterium]